VKKFKIKCFCKVNLFLRVIKRLNKNYHIIKSLITFCNLYDVITISKKKGFNDTIKFSGKFKKGIDKDNNIITKTLFLLRKQNYLKNHFFNINVNKNIPHGSGLGGGSSNAANLINFLIKKKIIQINKNETKNIARKIGFDVPIILKKKNTLLTGKNEEILRFNKNFRFNMLIIYPNLICSTRKIYHENRTITLNKAWSNKRFETNKSLISFLIREKNDLEDTVIKLYPKIGELIKIINSQKGCYFSRISGSGSSCIGIFSNMKGAISAKTRIKTKFPKYWCAVSKTI
jgi:4-diphosphocytidyl-2-C-methyl-D-erythritol kinase